MEINEACDRIFPKGNPVYYDEGNNYPFLIVSEENKTEWEIFFGKKEENHYKIIRRLRKNPIDITYEEMFRGRLFFDYKIIAFWKNPTKEELPVILNLISLKNKKINWSEWKIEIYHGKDKRGWSYTEPEDYDYIPIKDYVGSDNVPDEIYQQHILSPLNKKNKSTVRIPGWKQKQIKYKLPGETEIEAKRRLKYLYQENFITKFELFENKNT